LTTKAFRHWLKWLGFQILLIELKSPWEEGYNDSFNGKKMIVKDRGRTRHVYIKPRTPQFNGKVERSHRTEKEEFYQLFP
jgi:transposase InsO family protein